MFRRRPPPSRPAPSRHPLAAYQRGVDALRITVTQHFSPTTSLRKFHRNCLGKVAHSGGNSAAYIVAKLKRDVPAFAERLAVGEFRSAALAAGIVKPAPTWPERVLIAWQHCTPKERVALRKRLD